MRQALKDLFDAIEADDSEALKAVVAAHFPYNNWLLQKHNTLNPLEFAATHNKQKALDALALLSSIHMDHMELVRGNIMLTDNISFLDVAVLVNRQDIVKTRCGIVKQCIKPEQLAHAFMLAKKYKRDTALAILSECFGDEPQPPAATEHSQAGGTTLFALNVDSGDSASGASTSLTH